MNRSRLVLLTVLVSTVLALAIGSASWASRSAPTAAAAPVTLRFQYAHIPADFTTQVTFSDGVQGISSHTASVLNSSAGTIHGFIAHGRGFGITSAHQNGSLDAAVELQVQPKDGYTAISGQAFLPDGTTLTVQVNGGAAMPIAGLFQIQLPALGAPAPKPAPRPKKPPCPKHAATAAHRLSGSSVDRA